MEATLIHTGFMTLQRLAPRLWLELFLHQYLDLVHLWEKLQSLSVIEKLSWAPQSLPGCCEVSGYLIKGTVMPPRGTSLIFEVTRQESWVIELPVRNYSHHSECFCDLFVDVEIADEMPRCGIKGRQEQDDHLSHLNWSLGIGSKSGKLCQYYSSKQAWLLACI